MNRFFSPLLEWIRARPRTTTSPVSGTPVTEALTAKEHAESRKNLESLKQLAAIVESSNEAIISKTLDGTITSWNPAAERMFGYQADEIIGQNIRKLVPADRLEEESLLIDRLRRGERISQFETIRLRQDGSPVQVSIAISPIHDAEGKIVGASKILRDITDWKQTQHRLTLLDTCLAHLNDIVLVTEAEPLDEPGPRIVFANDALERLTGYTPAEVLGRSPRFLQGPKTDRTALKEIREALEKHEPIRRKVINYGKTGQEYLLEIDLVPIFDGNNRCTHFAAIQRDISEKERAILQIAEQAALLDKAQDAITVRDLEGRILFWNKGAENLYGWPRQEALGKKVADLIYKDANESRHDEVHRIVISQGEWTGEVQHLTKGRKEVTLESRLTLVRDKAGQPKSILSINTDITERKKIEAQFLRAQRMESIGTLAGGIAHDLNNILSPIMMSIDILKGISENAQAKTILETIEVSAKRGADIVRQVLSFARGLTGERIEIQPKHLVKDIDQILRESFPKNIDLQVNVPRDLWTIMGDPTQIHQILLNLCVNARDAMPQGGKLTLELDNTVIDEQYAAMNLAARPGRYVVLSVVDTGIGIPPENIEKIYEPFFTTKELGKGTGLGLSTVMAIVKSHEGFITVVSDPGKGTLFRIYLPATSNSADAKISTEGPSVHPSRGRGETILVIDDEVSLLTITGQTLEAFGYQVLTASDGAEAVALYAQYRDEIALVLTDMMMPVMDGPATIRALLRVDPDVKIVATSGLSEAAEAALSAETGVTHFLVKPYTAQTLLKTLSSVLHPSAKPAESQNPSPK